MRRSPGTIASEIGRGGEQHGALTCWRSVVERISYYNAKRLLEAPGNGHHGQGGKEGAGRGGNEDKSVDVRRKALQK